MKAILSYQNYFGFGKQYQVKFIYENKSETQTLYNWIKSLKEKKLIHPYYTDELGNISTKTTNIVGGTNIPKDILLTFISMLISINKINVIIGNQEFTSYNQNNIEKAINNLHINAILNRGNYLQNGETYYIVFKYANDEQRDEILYEFYRKLMPTAGHNSKRKQEGKEYILPFLVDKNGNLTLKNPAIIGGTNIPEDLLESYIKKFIEEYNMIVNIGPVQFKESFDRKAFEETITILQPGRSKKRTIQTT